MYWENRLQVWEKLDFSGALDGIFWPENLPESAISDEVDIISRTRTRKGKRKRKPCYESENLRCLSWGKVINWLVTYIVGDESWKALQWSRVLGNFHGPTLSPLYLLIFLFRYCLPRATTADLFFLFPIIPLFQSHHWFLEYLFMASYQGS